MTVSITGVVDRIVDGETAVVLLESDGDVVDQFTVPVERLPEEGQHEGAVFDVRLDEDDDVLPVDDPVGFTYRPETERDRREAAQDRFDRLSKRLDEE